MTTTRHPALLHREHAVIVLVDLQERYRSVLFGWDAVARACALLVRGAGILGVPVLVTEQYPRGLGHTTPDVGRWLPPDTRVIEKLTMSCCGAAAFRDALAATRRSQVLLAGIEAHACVNQTAHDLVADGYQVHLARDATSSRLKAFVPVAWEKMRAAGVLSASTEQALLELVRTAEAPEFKEIQGLLKEIQSPFDPDCA